MKKIISLFVFFGLLFTVHAQDFIIEDGVTVNTCEGTFYDTGGATGDYDFNENITYTICSDDPNGIINLDFIFWEVEGGWEEFYVYDGDDATAPLLYSYVLAGDPAPGYIEASPANVSGCLTFDFTSDGFINQGGWEAIIDCEICQPIEIELESSLPIVEDTIKNCLGVFLSAGLTFPDNGLYYDQSVETSTFEWIVEGDPNSPYNTQDIALEFTEQGVFEINLSVTDISDCTSETITLWVDNPSPASYLELFPNLDEMCLGESAVINYTLTHDIWYEEPVVSEPEPVFLDDVVGGSYESDLVLENVFDEGTTLDNIDCLTVWINMEHSYVGDLTINLYGPNDEQIILLEDQNGATPGNGAGPGFFGEPIDGDGFDPTPGTAYTYAFTASGSTIHSLVPFGVTLPESDIENGTDIYGFYNDDYSLITTTEVNGTWTLEIIDTFGSDNGFLFSWGIEFCDDLPLPIIDPDYEDALWTVYQDGTEIDNSSIITEEPTGIIVSPDEGGLYTYQLTFLDAFGCEWTDQVDIHVFDAPDGGADVTLLCEPEYTLPGVIDSPDGGYWTYIGPPGGVVTFDPSNQVEAPDITLTTLGEYIFVLHDNHCNSTDSVVVNVVSVIPEVIAEEELYCNFDMQLSIANPVQSGVWTGESIDGYHTISFADPNASSTIVTVEDFGEYYFTYTFDFCETSTTVHSTFLQENPVINTLPDSIACAKSISLSATVLGQEDHWEASGPGIVTFQDFEALTTEASVSEYGDYTFYYYGCSGVDSAKVVFTTEEPVISAPRFVECGFDAYIGLSYKGDPGVLSITGPGNAVFDANDPVGTLLTVDKYGEYFITYDACETSTTVSVTFMCELIIPNVFSPNQDGINDLFTIDRLDTDYYSKSYFTVYNRWGNVVYTNGNYGLNGVWWDGRNSLNGEILSQGVYYYTLELYNDVRGVEEEYKGNISVFSDED